MYTRLCKPLETRTFFLFGARGTGKSHLLRELFGSRALLWIDLLRDKDFVTYQKNPELLYTQTLSLLIGKESDIPLWIIVDEVQRVPQLLNEVHRVLESKEGNSKIYFALTGSSARKLKRGGANLLGGRALVNDLFPLTSFEIGEEFDLSAALNWGTLPYVVTEPDLITRRELLESYYATYLREEIKEEQVVRQLDPFTRFLEVAAQSSGQVLNYAAIARDCQVDEKAVARYYQILEDTLLGITLPSFDRSIRRQQSKSPKFYLFDIGVQRALSGVLSVPCTPQSYGYGRSFEQFIILEIHRLNCYLRKRFKMYFLRTKDNLEIDLIVERPGEPLLLIEIKSTEHVDIHAGRHIKAMSKEIPNSEAWIISQDNKSRLDQDVWLLNWREALLRIFPELA